MIYLLIVRFLGIAICFATVAFAPAKADTVYHYIGRESQAVQWVHPNVGRRNYRWFYNIDRTDRIRSMPRRYFSVQTVIRYTPTIFGNAGIRIDYEQRTVTEQYSITSDRGVDVLTDEDDIYGVDLDIAPHLTNRFNPVPYFSHRSFAYRKPKEIARLKSLNDRVWDNDVAMDADLSEHSGAAGTTYGTHSGSFFWRIESDGSFAETLQLTGATGKHAVSTDRSATVDESLPGFYLLHQEIGDPQNIGGKMVIPVTTVRRGREVGPPSPTPTPPPVQTLAPVWYPLDRPMRGDQVTQRTNAVLPSACKTGRALRADANDERSWLVDPADGDLRNEQNVLYLKNGVAVCITRDMTDRRYDVATGTLLKTQVEHTTLKLVANT